MLLLFALGSYLIDVNALIHDNEIPITPNEEFFKVYIESSVFDIDPDEYRLVVTGEVYNPLNLSLDEIKGMNTTSEIVRLTCVMGPRLTGVANWTGIRLSSLLDLAEVNFQNAIDISFQTPDTSSGGYSTSLSIEEAYWDDVILAYEMNEVPLPKEHGYPLRLVCPRFYGYKWIKWIAFINVTSYDYKGYWESTGYDDTPYVDTDVLPIYYPLTSENGSSSQAEQSSGFGFAVFLASLTTLTFSRLQKKKIHQY
jgi:DMSO/TMAO reductase YedYZ molybdopterin-dependent catalytic subunit